MHIPIHDRVPLEELANEYWEAGERRAFNEAWEIRQRMQRRCGDHAEKHINNAFEIRHMLGLSP